MGYYPIPNNDNKNDPKWPCTKCTFLNPENAEICGMCDFPRNETIDPPQSPSFFKEQEINPFDFQTPTIGSMTTNNYSDDFSVNNPGFDSYQNNRHSFIPQTCPNRGKFTSKIDVNHKKSVFNQNHDHKNRSNELDHYHNININESKSVSMSPPQFQSNPFSNNMNNDDGEENESKQQNININDINDINHIDIDEMEQGDMKKKEVKKMENVKANIIKNKKNKKMKQEKIII